MIAWLRDWWRAFTRAGNAERRLTALQRHLRHLEHERLAAETRAAASRVALGEAEKRMDARLTQIRRDIDAAEELNKRQAALLEATQKQLEIELTVTQPTLVAANETFRKMADAQSARYTLIGMRVPQEAE